MEMFVFVRRQPRSNDPKPNGVPSKWEKGNQFVLAFQSAD